MPGTVHIAGAGLAGLVGGLVNGDAIAASEQPDGGGKAGQTGAYDVDGARHQTMA